MPFFPSHGQRGCSRVSANMSSALLLLLLHSAIVLMCDALMAPAATVTRNPTLIDHFGDAIPLTMYVRLKRQTQNTFLFSFGGADNALTVDEGVVVENAEGRVLAQDDPNNAAAAAVLPDEWTLRDLELPFLGATTDKHRSQIVRNLPPAYGPRFGINRAVMLMANTTLLAAGKTLEDDAAVQQSDLAMRFSVGRGLQKESTWLPLATRHKIVSMITELLSNRLEALRGDGEHPQDPAALDERAKLEEELDEFQANRNHPAVRYLSKVVFYFGYQTGEKHKITSFAIDARYSPVQKPGIELQYIWNEHRPYNPNRALLFCSAASLLAAMIMMVVVFHPSSRSMLLFNQRIVAVRAHEW